MTPGSTQPAGLTPDLAEGEERVKAEPPATQVGPSIPADDV